MHRLMLIYSAMQTIRPQTPAHSPKGLVPDTWRTKTKMVPPIMLLRAAIAVALFQNKAPVIDGTAIKGPAEAAGQRGAIMNARLLFPAAHLSCH